MARLADSSVTPCYSLQNFQDDDFVLRNNESLQELIKADLELLSHDCLDTTECLIRLVTYYRAEIFKLQKQMARKNGPALVAREPMPACNSPRTLVPDFVG